MQPGADLNAMFEVRSAAKGFRRVIPRRIESIRPFKHVPNYDANYMKVHAYNHAGLSEYNDCWTGEMRSRPIPFVSTDRRPLKVQQIFERYIKAVFQFLLPDTQPAVQTINKISALGYPVFGNPGEGIDNNKRSATFGQKIYQSKFDVVLDCFATMQAGDFSIYDDGINTVGCRKQNEPPSKVREFQFISKDGSIYQQEITAAERKITVPSIGAMIGSRTRTITRPPVVNLWLQCWDTLLHNTIKRHPLFESNVYNHVKWPQDTYFVTFDCKHYERYLGLCALSYAQAVGGKYGELLTMLIKYPFVVPSDDWSTFFEVRPLYREGIYPQFSSGLSPVAPLGKLANICVQVAYFVEVQHLDLRSAIATVLSGVSHGMRRWCFGDDNRIMGDPRAVDEFVAYMGTFFEIEVDEVSRYLGTVFRPDIGRWMLPAETYNLKLYQPERDYEWKDYPNLGMVERRAIFTEFGEPEIGASIIPFEDDLWTEVGHPYSEIAASAVAERIASQRKGVRLNQFLVTDKDYLMTEEEKARSGLFWHLRPDVTATIVVSLVGDEIRDQLKFKNINPVLVPISERRFLSPLIEVGSEDTEIQEPTYAEET